MAKIDPERERQRLAEFYAGQLDGELEKVAAEAYELSNLALEALKTELLKRGLGGPLAEHPAVLVKRPPELGNPLEEDKLEMEPPSHEFKEPAGEAHEGEAGGLRDVVAIRIFRDLPQALLAKGCLESAGIECALADDNTIRMDWFYSNAIGGIKLLVDAKDAEEANQLLNQPIPERLDVSGVGDYEQPKCPSCGSLDVNFRELDPATYLSLGGSYLGVFVPVPIHRRAWSCHSCDVEWEDDGVPGSAESSA